MSDKKLYKWRLPYYKEAIGFYEVIATNKTEAIKEFEDGEYEEFENKSFEDFDYDDFYGEEIPK